MADLYYKDAQKKKVLYSLTLLVTSLIFYSFIINPFGKHDIRKGHESRLETNRDTLINYYWNWKKHHGINHKDTIYLVSGQGGGSRAAAWTYLNLEKMYEKPIFAISTVSGSSSGANNFIFKKWFDLRLGVKNQDTNFCGKLYVYNYLSQSIWGLLMKDGLLNRVLNQHDRNYYHQEEERRQLVKAYQSSIRSKDDEKHFIQLLDSDYIEKWQSNRKFDLPLLFTNATTTQTGKRTICSPVQFEPDLFCTALDMYKAFHDTYPYNALLSHTCVNVSQSFPFTSAASYIQSVANFADGAFYENTGSNTLFEIYDYLKRRDPYQKFKIVSINNSRQEAQFTSEHKSEILSTLSTSTTSSLSGHSYYWMKKLELECKLHGDIYEENALYTKLRKDQEVALAIYLSNQTMQVLYRAVKLN
jgi:hypothetical protein